MKPSLLLHSCCGPCSTSVIARLFDDYQITLFYYNPCITDSGEYEKRKENQILFLNAWNREHPDDPDISFREGGRDSEEYFSLVRGLEQEPEGGARCTVCFRQRLEGAAAFADTLGIPLFTTTLTVSPHKDYSRISAIGREIASRYEDLDFLDLDFKKKNGFGRSVQMSKQYGLYRQNFCGCEFSRR